ncbi:MAG: hypothetical protein JWL69_1350, partial [Phycisphaerales bacterium]|nr:hypothetical protein [Phycisphaerales bacterium]
NSFGLQPSAFGRRVSRRAWWRNRGSPLFRPDACSLPPSEEEAWDFYFARLMRSPGLTPLRRDGSCGRPRVNEPFSAGLWS